jgi:hypothetical protein
MNALLSWRPMQAWPVEETQHRRQAAFTAERRKTERLLSREAGMLGASRAVIEVDASSRSFRADGQLAMNALVTFPGVAVHMDTRHGPLRYATDVFDHWADNLRGVALALEALRAVDRYGVSTAGQQYRGWAALPAGTGRDVAALFDGPDDARRFIRAAAGREFSHLPLPEQYRIVRARMHPDAPEGSRDQWDRLGAAAALLAGELKGQR